MHAPAGRALGGELLRNCSKREDVCSTAAGRLPVHLDVYG
eukprot:COSAG01_NODE_1990_length_8697_cov_5.164922_14_plen_40_part_00